MDTDKDMIELDPSVTSVSSVAMPSSLPVPNAPISVRVGTREDVPFIDALQKQYGKALGFFPRAQLEGYIDAGNVLVAMDQAGAAVGYVAARDRYLKRDELGVIYQLCVSPSAQRGLIGATLLKELFARSAYGCRLYCCWCAQDLAANRFWEAMGFNAIAFRGGSAKKGRTHIFWQKRIRAGDTSTPWWFPAKTEGGAMREDRLVLPIPSGLVWSDPMPLMRTEAEVPRRRLSSDAASSRPRRKMALEDKRPRVRAQRAMQFGPPSEAPAVESSSTPKPVQRNAQAKRESKPCDPQLIAAARELRDRWLEAMNATPQDAIAGKYDVSRAAESHVGHPQRSGSIVEQRTPHLLEAA